MASSSCLCRRALGGPPERQTFGDLRVPKEELPPADAKPQYHTIIATVAHIDAQQALYYEACPDNNRKVRDFSDRSKGCPQCNLRELSDSDMCCAMISRMPWKCGCVWRCSLPSAMPGNCCAWAVARVNCGKAPMQGRGNIGGRCGPYCISFLKRVGRELLRRW